MKYPGLSPLPIFFLYRQGTSSYANKRPATHLKLKRLIRTISISIRTHLCSLQKQFERPFSLTEIRILYTGNRALDVVASGIEGMLENTRVVTHRRMARKQIQTMGSIRRYALMRLAVIPVWVVSVWEMRCFTMPKRAGGRSGSSWRASRMDPGEILQET